VGGVYVPHVFRKALSITPHSLSCTLFASFNIHVYELYERGGKGQNETSQNMFLFWEGTMFGLLCYGRPPYPKDILVVGSHMAICEIFTLKKLCMHLRLVGGGGGDFFFCLFPMCS
jgi:hypothetical protein